MDELNPFDLSITSQFLWNQCLRVPPGSRGFVMPPSPTLKVGGAQSVLLGKQL